MLNCLVDTIPAAWWLRHGTTGPAARTRPGIEFVKLRRATIRYRVLGRGEPTIVVAPDPPITFEQYDQILTRLSARHRVVVFEGPGMGFSPPALRFDFRLESYVDVALEFLERLALGPYVLALPCIAGYVAIACARRVPSAVCGVVTSQLSTWQDSRRWASGRTNARLLELPVVGQAALWLVRQRRASNFFREVCVKNTDEFVALTDWAMSQGVCFSFASILQRYLRASQPELVARLESTNALSLWSSLDPSYQCLGVDGTAIRELLPGTTLVNFDHCGHYLEIEEPDRYTDLLLDFAGQQRVRTSSPR